MAKHLLFFKCNARAFKRASRNLSRKVSDLGFAAFSTKLKWVAEKHGWASSWQFPVGYGGRAFRHLCDGVQHSGDLGIDLAF